MPWGAVTVMELKHQFILSYLEHRRSITTLAHEFGISRKTAYKWITRYSSDGMQGLNDLRVNSGTNSTYQEEIWERVISLRLSYPTYGPRKLRHILQRDYPDILWPSESRIKQELRKRKLSCPYTPQPPHELMKDRLPLKEINGNNAVWCMDFKGHIKTSDKLIYEPFTLMDGHSRYLLCCKSSGRDSVSVQRILTDVFMEYGLPRSIRSDNGTPFGSAGFRGLSLLSVWLLKHGIWPDKIEPARPQQNGRLERFHRTLKQDVMVGARVLYDEYVARTNEFIRQYNCYRPHESLDYKTPSDVYRKSDIPYTGMIEEYSYPYGYEVVRVALNGYIRNAGVNIYLSESLRGEWVGIGQKTANGTPIQFYGYPLGYIEQHLSRKRK